jgi:hypothetical protein
MPFCSRSDAGNYQFVINFTMETKKLNFKIIKNALSRIEMKKIMAGSDSGNPGGGGSGGSGGCSVLIYCLNQYGNVGHTVLGNTCNPSAQLQQCWAAGFTDTISTNSDCPC